MSRIADGLQAFASSLGAPGLFVIAFLDSSFLSLPEINDLLLVWMVTRDNSGALVYAATSTLGSMGGCLTLYSIGRRGGDAVVRRRFRTAAVDRALATVRRYGVLAVLVPSLLPPPAPFKIFVLLAGVSHLRVTSFVATIAIGRGIRYFGEAYLALRYGDQAMAWIHANGRTFALSVAVVAGVLFGGYLLWQKAQARAAG